MSKMQPMGNFQDFKTLLRFIKSFKHLLQALIIFLPIYVFSGCGLNPIPAPGVISGTDSLFATTNGDAIYIFSKSGENYGALKLTAYVTSAVLLTPQGGGIQKSSINLEEAPETGYSASEECGYYYYYMITDAAPHYAKVLIRTMETQDGISIHFNWWLQTDAGVRSF